MSRAIADALAYVRPTFMLPAVGMSAYGALLAPAAAFDPRIVALHAVAVGVALFVAHLRDGLVDGHFREEEDPRLSVAAFRWGIRAGVALGTAFAAALSVAAGPLAGASIAGLLALALLHAPYLDRHPVTVTVDYPAGIALVIVGGYAAQSADPSPGVVAVAALFFGLLAGIKVGIDALDADFDRSIDKRTVPVALGPRRADRVAGVIFGFVTLGTLGVAAAGTVGALGVDAPFVLAAALGPLGCLAATALTGGERTVRLQMGLIYVFAGFLFFGACVGRCAGAALVTRALGAVGIV
ncbi:hypothetical protein [Halobellus rubicundus]|uniref:Ubiquinone biosynthesis protein UbiA n=1 Tax=Halobellus rubicundus TaxID=2996466 RepID=A0ABD5MDA7_9EURY